MSGRSDAKNGDGDEEPPRGTPATRRFYDETGWIEAQGQLGDGQLFGNRQDGPIRRSAYRRRLERIRTGLSRAPAKLELLEAGCGGTPAAFLLDLCSHYVGVDFSKSGIQAAQRILDGSGVPHRLQVSDITKLPFEDGRFDAVYSAHAIYHIEDPAGQQRAFEELMRVLKPGGRAVFILANPRPLAFPLIVFRRLIADTPILSSIANRFRRRPPLPYQPMTLGWMRRRLKGFGEVSIRGYAIASTAFNRNVSEVRGIGRLAWKTIRWLERLYPRLSARLGNYVQITVEKRPESPR